MARDANANERIESILHGFGVDKSGLIARTIYEQEVLPILDHLARVTALQNGTPTTGIQASKWTQNAMMALEDSRDKRPNNGAVAPAPEVPLLIDVGFAHGGYQQTCHDCKRQHVAAKRCSCCENCAKARLRLNYLDANYTEADLDYVETSRSGREAWKLKDGRYVPIPERWSNDIPGVRGFSGVIVSKDGKTEI